MSKIEFKVIGTRPENQIPAPDCGLKGQSKYQPIINHVRAELKKWPGNAIELQMEKDVAVRFQHSCLTRAKDLVVQVRGNRVFVTAKKGGA